MAAILAAFALSLDAVAADASRWGKGYVPNHPVLAQDGKSFNFYDDLIQDRIAVVSFIYTSCSEICPVATARLSQLQEKLGDHMGREAFGFTHCPDVCPTTLMDWSNVLASLGPDGDRLKVLFISVDPERDTPAALKSYMTSFDPRITALTGSAGELAAVAAAFGAHYTKMVGKDGSVSFDHSIKTYILDRKAQLAALSDPQSEENSRAARLRKLIGRD